MTRTEGGAMMLRVKGMVVIPGNERSEAEWRKSRARDLAKLIAWHRRHPRGYSLRPQIMDSVDDCGWPKLSWLKRRVRMEQARIAASLAEFYRD